MAWLYLIALACVNRLAGRTEMSQTPGRLAIG